MLERLQAIREHVFSHLEQMANVGHSFAATNEALKAIATINLLIEEEEENIAETEEVASPGEPYSSTNPCILCTVESPCVLCRMSTPPF